jgi:hypothetical protein
LLCSPQLTATGAGDGNSWFTVQDNNSVTTHRKTKLSGKYIFSSLIKYNLTLNILKIIKLYWYIKQLLPAIGPYAE